MIFGFTGTGGGGPFLLKLFSLIKFWGKMKSTEWRFSNIFSGCTFGGCETQDALRFRVLTLSVFPFSKADRLLKTRDSLFVSNNFALDFGSSRPVGALIPALNIASFSANDFPFLDSLGLISGFGIPRKNDYKN